LRLRSPKATAREGAAVRAAVDSPSGRAEACPIPTPKRTHSLAEVPTSAVSRLNPTCFSDRSFHPIAMPFEVRRSDAIAASSSYLLAHALAPLPAALPRTLPRTRQFNRQFIRHFAGHLNPQLNPPLNRHVTCPVNRQVTLYVSSQFSRHIIRQLSPHFNRQIAIQLNGDVTCRVT